MENLLLFEQYRLNSSRDFWKDLDKTAQEMIKKDNYHPFWKFVKKYPDFDEIKSYTQDKIVVPLANKGKIKKNITFEEKIIFMLNSLKKLNKISPLKDFIDFKDWIENAEISIYRGIPTEWKFFKKEYQPTFKDKPKELETNQLASFSLNKDDVALKFTQPGWGAKAWKKEEDRNGWVVTATIKPKDIHIWNNEMGEEEIVVKGPLKYDKIEKVVKGKYVN